VSARCRLFCKSCDYIQPGGKESNFFVLLDVYVPLCLSPRLPCVSPRCAACAHPSLAVCPCGSPETFSISVGAVERAYRNGQRKVHPDKFESRTQVGARVFL
jgi:hypothetical protein